LLLSAVRLIDGERAWSHNVVSAATVVT